MNIITAGMKWVEIKYFCFANSAWSYLTHYYTKHFGTRNAKSIRLCLPSVRDFAVDRALMFEIRPIEGKGSGIVATQLIKAGTVIIREVPIMALSRSFVEQCVGFVPTEVYETISRFCHSCESNCYSEMTNESTQEMTVRALTTIPPKN